MLNNKVLISMLAVLFFLGFAGVTMALEYDEEVFDQTDNTMQMEVEQGKTVEAEGTLAPKHDMKDPVNILCATNISPETSPEAEPAIIDCYGS